MFGETRLFFVDRNHHVVSPFFCFAFAQGDLKKNTVRVGEVAFPLLPIKQQGKGLDQHYCIGGNPSSVECAERIQHTPLCKLVCADPTLVSPTAMRAFRRRSLGLIAGTVLKISLPILSFCFGKRKCVPWWSLRTVQYLQSHHLKSPGKGKGNAFTKSRARLPAR